MANTADIKAVITAEDRASSVLKGFSDNVGGIGGKIAGIAEVAGKALLAAGGAAVAFGALSVKSYSESENVQTQLVAVLKSTHEAAKLQLQDLNEQSAALQKVTKFSDEQVGSAQAMLLTFTQIHGAVFQKAIPAILDLATAMHEDLQSASIQVGKALNDPVTGITALHRIGVTFSETQKQQIQNFVDANNLAAAQGVILKELTKEFGGSAVAAGNTFAGSLMKLKNSFDDVKESVGKVIVQALTPFVAKLADVIARVDWQKVIHNTVNALKTFVEVLKQTFEKIMDVYNSIINYIEPGFNRFVDIVERITHVIVEVFWPSLKQLADTIETRLMPQILKLWKILEPALTDALKVIAVVIGVVVVGAIWIFINALNVVLSVLGFVIRIIGDLISWFGNLGGVIINIFRGIPNAIGKAFDGLVDIITWPFREAFKIIKAGIKDVVDLFNHVKHDITGAPSNLLHGIGGLLGHIPGFAEGGTVPGAIGQPMLAVVHGGEQVIPNGKSPSGANINISINAGAFTGSQIDARKHALQILKALQDAAASKNTTVGSLIGVA
ncbi:MAG: hypothetical protein EPO02_13580 [Nitrospirae bacterium]|nr:MAG: hypothetical protein EPO02_13580 [Nitrospirota bacterium]